MPVATEKDIHLLNLLFQLATERAKETKLQAAADSLGKTDRARILHAHLPTVAFQIRGGVMN